ncbi:MAG: 50S ribosomal protein L35 [Candidatus Magasanikbacteria bacterium]
MSKLKTHKAIAKRFKITKNGKIIKRTNGQGHYNSRETGNTRRNKRSDVTFDKSMGKHVTRRLPNA